MKLTVQIPVEKIIVNGGHSYRYELVEVEPVRIIRNPARHDKDCYPWKVTGWYYSADVLHPRLSPDAILLHHIDRAYRSRVIRSLNKHWKPPVFPDGKNWVTVGESQA